MAWETDRHGRTRYVQKLRIDGRVISKVLGTGEAGQRAEHQIILVGTRKCERRDEEQLRSTKLDNSIKTAKQIFEQTITFSGFIKRNHESRAHQRYREPVANREVRFFPGVA